MQTAGAQGARAVKAALINVPRPRNGNGRAIGRFNAADFLAKAGLGTAIENCPKGTAIFSQGDTADGVFYIQKGKVKISVVSVHGKEATVAVLGAGEFVGEDCIATTHPLRLV